ncbi:membrane protein [Candidatus Magnetoovum chiemensis]|nr:membrane protein [Candidatus Magnetoovum chiemensis]
MNCFRALSLLSINLPRINFLTTMFSIGVLTIASLLFSNPNSFKKASAWFFVTGSGAVSIVLRYLFKKSSTSLSLISLVRRLNSLSVSSLDTPF